METVFTQLTGFCDHPKCVEKTRLNMMDVEDLVEGIKRQHLSSLPKTKTVNAKDVGC